MVKKYIAGKHFLQLPGPSNVPDRILRAMDYPTIDHRGPEFSILANDCLEGIKTIFKTKSNVIIYPASGTGAWEAALVNTLNENDLALMVETGHFASLWNKMAQKLGIKTEFLKTDWQRGAIPEKIYERLKKDSENKSTAETTAQNINNLKFTKEIAAKDNGELYGSLSVSDIVTFLNEHSISIQKKSIKLGNKIKTTGEYSVEIDLHPEVDCSLSIEILSPKSSA